MIFIIYHDVPHVTERCVSTMELDYATMSFANLPQTQPLYQQTKPNPQCIKSINKPAQWSVRPTTTKSLFSMDVSQPSHDQPQNNIYDISTEQPTHHKLPTRQTRLDDIRQGQATMLSRKRDIRHCLDVVRTSAILY